MIRLSTEDVKAVAEHVIEGLRPIVIAEVRTLVQEKVAIWLREYAKLGAPVPVTVPTPPEPTVEVHFVAPRKSKPRKKAAKKR